MQSIGSFPFNTWIIIFFVAGLVWPDVVLAEHPQTHSAQVRYMTSQHGLPQAFVPGLAQDKTGFIWIATRDGLARYDGRGFRVFRHRNDDPQTISDNVIYWMEQLSDKRLLIYSEKGDLDLFDPNTEQFTHLSQEPFYPRMLYHDVYDIAGDDTFWTMTPGKLMQMDWAKKTVFPVAIPELTHRKCGQLLVSRANIVYIVTDVGLYQYDLKRKTGLFLRSDIPLDVSHTPLKMSEHANGDILIGQKNALVIFRPKNRVFRRLFFPEANPVYPMHTAGDGHTYLGIGNTVYRLTRRNQLQRIWTDKKGENRFFRSILVDRTGLIWLGTDAEGVRVVNRQPLPFQPIPYQKGFLDDLFIRMLGVKPPIWEKWSGPYALKYSTDSAGNGWFLNSPSLMKFNAKTRRIERKNWQKFLPAHKKDIGIGCLHLRPDGTIWLLAENYLIQTDTAFANGRTIVLPLKKNRQLNDILLPGFSEIVERNGRIYMATVEGLVVADPNGRKPLQFIRSRPGQANSLSSDNLVSLCPDPFQPAVLWIGTLGGGLNRYDTQTNQFQLFTESDGLPNGTIYTLLPDRKGYLWISTNKGICRFDPRTGQTRNFTAQDGLQDDEFNRFHRAVLPDGRFLMGGISGMTVFNPLSLSDQLADPIPALFALKIGNVLIAGRLADSLNIPPIHQTRELRLRHDQNFLTFEFGVLDYENPQKIQYRYRLRGIESNWVIAGTQNSANYAHLAPGRYQFEINATNRSGAWSRASRQLAILITPPWWQTRWAYLGYGLLLIGTLWLSIRIYLNRLNSQQHTLLKEQEARQLRELDELKTRFFSNITHEFRTPLTLILSPVTQMITEPARQPKDVHRLAMVEKNATHLLGLINQLMDLSKLESKAMTVRESLGNLSESVRQGLQAFKEQAREQQIQLEFTTELVGDFWFDREKLKLILYNLLSNAVKFSDPNGRITVWLGRRDDQVQVVVTDTGIGMDLQTLPHIFDRFYQVEDAPGGTGIGLALVKELVEVQQGNIAVESTKGIGTTFTVSLPYRPAQPEDLRERVAHSAPDPLLATSTFQESEPISVLLVEDNRELGDFIADCLPDEFRIHRATNGAEGMKQAFEWLPDLVVSDVLMPEMDGFTFCHALKSDFRTSHIPVILLTAKASVDSRLEGLELGADDYLTKPFHVRELLLRIRNQLERQQKLREWFQHKLTRTDQGSASLLTVDPFLAKVYTQLDTRLDDATYGVEELASDLGVGRYTFLRKSKALTAMPPNELIRNYRLKRSLDYLRQGRSIAETATLVGFETPSYFTKCFRDLYQMTPTEVTKHGLPKN